MSNSGTVSGWSACNYGQLTGLTLSGTNILKVTGQCGTGSSNNDILAGMGTVSYVPA